MPRRLVFIFFALISFACLLPVGSMFQPTPTVDIPANKTDAATLSSQQTVMAMITIPPSMTPTPTFTPLPTYKPLPTPLPTINPILLPDLLKTKLTTQPEVFNGHPIQEITGWDYGFSDFEWMDKNHLLLTAIVGKIPNAEHSSGILTYEAIINLNSGKIWTVGLQWFSERLHKIILTGDEKVGIYNLDGEFEKSYPGKLLGISPSGTKLLFKDGTWLDLITGKTVKFAWDPNHVAPYSNRPVWSENENRVFVCCYVYGDANTGDGYDQWDNGIGSESLGYGKWVSNDKYLLGRPSLELFISPPLFDVSTKSIRTVGELAGIPQKVDGDDNMCNFWDIAPNGKFVWISCFDGSHLVNLSNFKSKNYPDYPLSSIGDIYWSADNSFARIALIDFNLKNPSDRIVFINSGELKPVPDGYSCSWHPTDNILLCLSNKNQTVSLLDARTVSIKKSLDFSSKVQSFFWTPDNKLIVLFNTGQTLSLLDTKTFIVQKELALSVQAQELSASPDKKQIVLLARDSSFWQFDYPTLENLEQLTPAMPQLSRKNVHLNLLESQIKDISWSPDGGFLAFIADKDIYIVDASPKP